MIWVLPKLDQCKFTCVINMFILYIFLYGLLYSSSGTLWPWCFNKKPYGYGYSTSAVKCQYTKAVLGSASRQCIV